MLDDARKVSRDLSGNDRRKSDEYLRIVCEVEHRIFAPLAKKERLSREGKLIRPGEEVPEDFGEHIHLPGDLLVLAFQADATRACSFMIGNASIYRSTHKV